MKTVASSSSSVMISSVTASAAGRPLSPPLSILQALSGRPLPLHQSPNRSQKHSGDASKNTRAPYSYPAPKQNTRESKYDNWKVEPFKSAPARAVEIKIERPQPTISIGRYYPSGRGLFELVFKYTKGRSREAGSVVNALFEGFMFAWRKQKC